jgi:hypothetical protein
MSTAAATAAAAATTAAAAAVEGWIKAFKEAELEFGDSEELVAKLEELIEAAPEAEEDSEDSD